MSAVYTIRHGALYLSALRRVRWVSSRELARPFQTRAAAASFLIAISADEHRDEFDYVIESFHQPSKEDL